MLWTCVVKLLHRTPKEHPCQIFGKVCIMFPKTEMLNRILCNYHLGHPMSDMWTSYVWSLIRPTAVTKIFHISHHTTLIWQPCLFRIWEYYLTNNTNQLQDKPQNRRGYTCVLFELIFCENPNIMFCSNDQLHTPDAIYHENVFFLCIKCYL